MSNELETMPTMTYELTMKREPSDILQEAKKAADALKDIISKKPKPVIMNGEQYLEFEDWQTVARFYGITVKVVDTKPLTIGEVIGFEARAVALRADGQEISGAEAMCLNDEKNWASKPLFQLRSMAQTRACAKALRNVLAWVVVLAGYRPTPAEEMTSETTEQHTTEKKLISEAQRKRLYAIWKGAGKTDAFVQGYLSEQYGIMKTTEIPLDFYDEIVKWAENKETNPKNG